MNDPPSIAQLGDQNITVGVPVALSIPVTDSDNDPVAGSVAGLPAGLSSSFNAATDEIRISGTVTNLSFVGATVSVTAEASDNGSPSEDAAPMTFNLVFDDIALSPHVGNFVINEVLYAESEKYSPAAPFAALVMDEYIEFRNTGPNINIEDWFLSDTKYPLLADDYDFAGPGPLQPDEPGRIFQAFTQSTPISAGEIVTAPLRRPTSTSYELDDGSTRPSSTYNFRGTAFGFPAGPNSNWEALNDRGDDLWFWDDQGRLVAYVAWDDGSGSAHITDRPDPSWGLWDPADEARLAGAAPGQSISLAGPTNSSTCWELTGSGDATCAGNFTSQNQDGGLTTPSGRNSSQGLTN